MGDFIPWDWINSNFFVFFCIPNSNSLGKYLSFRFDCPLLSAFFVVVASRKRISWQNDHMFNSISSSSTLFKGYQSVHVITDEILWNIDQVNNVFTCYLPKFITSQKSPIMFIIFSFPLLFEIIGICPCFSFLYQL